MLEVVPPQVQDFAPFLCELFEVPVSAFLQPTEVLLDGSTTLRCISYFSHFCIISKLVEGTLCPVIQMINADVEQDWTQY